MVPFIRAGPRPPIATNRARTVHVPVGLRPAFAPRAEGVKARAYLSRQTSTIYSPFGGDVRKINGVVNVFPLIITDADDCPCGESRRTGLHFFSIG